MDIDIKIIEILKLKLNQSVNKVVAIECKYSSKLVDLFSCLDKIFILLFLCLVLF